MKEKEEEREEARVGEEKEGMSRSKKRGRRGGQKGRR